MYYSIMYSVYVCVCIPRRPPPFPVNSLSLSLRSYFFLKYLYIYHASYNNLS